ncbi:MAG: hypothetical protein LBK73_11840 [Treponema sp.]|nr:hypothetical protein [Treponema sp.]
MQAQPIFIQKTMTPPPPPLCKRDRHSSLAKVAGEALHFSALKAHGVAITPCKIRGSL